VDTIFKALSKRERTIYAKLTARLEHAEQSALLPATPLPEAKPAPQRAHRVQHRRGSFDGEVALDPEALAYCVKEAARLMGVSRATLYVLISTGTLRTVKIRKRRLVPRQALLELLAGGAA
jgi:excisionase family DNA binding protein